LEDHGRRNGNGKGNFYGNGNGNGNLNRAKESAKNAKARKLPRQQQWKCAQVRF